MKKTAIPKKRKKAVVATEMPMGFAEVSQETGVPEVLEAAAVPEIKLDEPLKIEQAAPTAMQSGGQAAETTENGESYGKGKWQFALGAGVAIILLIISGGLYWRYNQEAKEAAKVEATPTPAATPTIAVLDRAQWSFEVLNGSGVSGRARAAANQLAALGYTVVGLGNAERVSGNQLFVAKDKLAKAALLVEDLKKDFGITTVTGELTDSMMSARLVIGL